MEGNIKTSYALKERCEIFFICKFNADEGGAGGTTRRPPGLVATLGRQVIARRPVAAASTGPRHVQRGGRRRALRRWQLPPT